MAALSLAESKNKKAVLDERTACSVKMVAGARNHRNLPIEILALFAGATVRPFDAAG